jgi:hypothetical protein
LEENKKEIPEGGERERGLNDERDRMGDEEEEVTFNFPILDMPTTFGNEIKMKNIPPSVIPNFYGMALKTSMHSYLNLIFYVVHMDILMMLTSF